MFKESNENVIRGKNPQKDIEFSKEKFYEISEDFDRFTDNLLKENEIDPDNLGYTWSGTREVSLLEVKGRYILAIYANMEARDQLLSNKEPKILEVGPYMTGLIPAMYLASKGFEPEVMDIFPVKRSFPNLSEIAEEKYGVKIHENDIGKLPESFKGKYDMVYIQSFPPLGSKFEEIIAENVSSLLKEDGLFLVNDGGGIDMFSTFPPHFTEVMGLQWRYLAESLNLNNYEDSRISVLRKNSGLERVIFYLKKEFGEMAWPIAQYNFVKEKYSDNDNIDFEKFTRGHIYSLIMYDNRREFPEMSKEDFDFYKVSEAYNLINAKTYWISRMNSYLPDSIRNIVQEYKSNIGDLNVFTLRSPQSYWSFIRSWVTELKNPIETLITNQSEYQEEIAYYNEVCQELEDEWSGYIEMVKEKGGVLR